MELRRIRSYEENHKSIAFRFLIFAKMIVLEIAILQIKYNFVK